MFDVFILWEHVQTISGGMVCLCLHLGTVFFRLPISVAL